jgi:F-type H+/Na+-transporting ATPase subunit alpha
VGGSAQIKAMRTVAGRLKIDLAQFRALEAFALFASDLDAASRQQLSRGQRLMELLKQGQYSPYPVEEQVVSVWLGTTGQLDDIAVGDVRQFEREFLDHLRRSSKVLTTIKETGKFEDDTAEALKGEVETFKKTFRTEDRNVVEAGHEESAALGDEDVEQEQIVRQKRG